MPRGGTCHVVLLRLQFSQVEGQGEGAPRAAEAVAANRCPQVWGEKGRMR